MNHVIMLPIFILSQLLYVEGSQVLPCKDLSTCSPFYTHNFSNIESICKNHHNLHFRQLTNTIVPPGIFLNCSKVLLLDLSNNKIQSVSVSSFVGLSSVNQMYLSNNRLEDIEAATFHALVLLEVLVLSQNMIKTISDYKVTWRTLKYLNMNRNQLIHLEQYALHHVIFVDVIDLSNNELQDIHPNALENLEPGAVLVFNNNKLKNASLVFKNMHPKVFTELHIAGNLIDSLSNATFGEFYKLNLCVLDVSFNIITSIQSGTFDNYHTLKSIMLAYNKLRFIEQAIFKKTVNLESLDLSHNELSNAVQYAIFPNHLKYLNLSHNQLGPDMDLFFMAATIGRLVVLHLDANKISVLDPEILSHLTYRISMSKNMWNCKVLNWLLKTLPGHRVKVERGYYSHVVNVHGIACSYFLHTIESINTKETSSNIFNALNSDCNEARTCDSATERNNITTNTTLTSNNYTTDILSGKVDIPKVTGDVNNRRPNNIIIIAITLFSVVLM